MSLVCSRVSYAVDVVDTVEYLTWACRVADAVDAVEYRVAKTHRMPYLHRSFSAKEPYN